MRLVLSTENDRKRRDLTKIGPYGPELIWHFGT